jgi:hypothetical protein
MTNLAPPIAQAKAAAPLSGANLHPCPRSATVDRGDTDRRHAVDGDHRQLARRGPGGFRRRP